MTGHRSIYRWFLGGEPQWPKTLKSLLPFHIVLARREKPISQWINGVILRSWTWLYSWSSAIDKGGTNTLTREQERLCTAKTFIKLFYVHVFYLVNSLETSRQWWLWTSQGRTICLNACIPLLRGVVNQLYSVAENSH